MPSIESVLNERTPTLCRNSNSHFWSLPGTQALALRVFECLLPLSHLAECSQIPTPVIAAVLIPIGR